jgi:hypothetical protein
LAASDSWLALFPAVIAIAVLGGVRLIQPST